MSGPLALPAFANTQVGWSVLWPIGVAHPTISSGCYGPSFPDHYRVYRSLTRNFSDASDVSGSLAASPVYGTGASFTDTAVSINGVGHVYWMVGFDSGETHATYASSLASTEFPSITPPAGVLCCQQHIIATGLTMTGPDDQGGTPTPAVASFPFTTLELVAGGVGQCFATVILTMGTFVPGTPYVPDVARAGMQFIDADLLSLVWAPLPETSGPADPGGGVYTHGPIRCDIPVGAPPTSFPGIHLLAKPLVTDSPTWWGISPPAESTPVTLDGALVYVELAAVYNSPSSVRMFTQSHIFASQAPPLPPPPPPTPAWVIALGALAGGTLPYVAADFANGNYWDQVNGVTTLNAQWVQNLTWGPWNSANITPSQGIPNFASSAANQPVLAPGLASGLLGHLPFTVLARTTGTGVNGPWYMGIANNAFSAMMYTLNTPTGNHLGFMHSGEREGGDSFGSSGLTHSTPTTGHNVAMAMMADYSANVSVDGASNLSVTIPSGSISPATLIGLAGNSPSSADLWLGLAAIWQGDLSAHLPAMSA